MLAWSAIPQAVLLLLLAWWLRRAIDRDLHPLAQLQHALERRDANDLNPLPASLTAHASTADVERLGSALDSLLVRLSASMTAQREFAGNVAHELRTPLAGIRAQATYALGHSDPAVWRGQLQAIAQGEQRATHLVDQLLALARAESGGQVVARHPCDLAQLTREVVRDCVPRAMEKHIDLGYDGAQPGASGTQLQGNPVLLKEMIRNLLDNAISYTPSSAEQPAVITARVVAGSGRDLLLQVEDSGPGIPATERELVFQPFYRPADTVIDGSGLGLAIVREVAEQHGAEISVADARPGAVPPGTRFNVRFPAGGQGQGAAADRASAQVGW
jgi:two-component system sensor histidine kinase TctE